MIAGLSDKDPVSGDHPHVQKLQSYIEDATVELERQQTLVKNQFNELKTLAKETRDKIDNILEYLRKVRNDDYHQIQEMLLTMIPGEISPEHRYELVNSLLEDLKEKLSSAHSEVSSTLGNVSDLTNQLNQVVLTEQLANQLKNATAKVLDYHSKIQEFQSGYQYGVSVRQMKKNGKS